MQRFWSQPLLRQLLIAILVLLLPLLGAAMWSGKRAFEERVDDIRDRAVFASTTAAAYLNRYLGSLDLTATALTLHPGVQALDAAAASALFERTRPLEPALLNVALVGANRRKVAHASDPALEIVAREEWAEPVMAAGKRLVMPLQTTAHTGVKFVIIGYPVRNRDGAITGALGFHIGLRTIQSI